jgi:hypothetical protein
MICRLPRLPSREYPNARRPAQLPRPDRGPARFDRACIAWSTRGGSQDARQRDRSTGRTIHGSTELAVNISPSREVIFEPGDEYEFQDSLIEELVRFAVNFSRELGAALKELPHLTVITYPAHLDSDTLLHAVVAHEIAHLALDRIHPGEPTSIGSQLINTSLDRQFDDLLTELGSAADAEGEPTDGEQFARRERDTRRRVKKWFEELACDSLALRMVGPAYVFALADLDLPTNRWAQKRGMPGYETHPGLA